MFSVFAPGRSLVVAAIAAVVLGLAGSPPAAAQATTATVAGTVKDAQGGVIPGATVTLISESRGTTFETVANAAGDFVISNIPGDTYTVRVATEGSRPPSAKAWRSRPATVWRSAP